MGNVERFVVGLILMFMVACAQMGLPTASTCNEKVAVALGTVTSARTTATTLLTAKKITADDAQNVLKQTDAAREGVEIARVACAANPLGADNKLTAVTTVLQAISGYLATKGN